MNETTHVYAGAAKAGPRFKGGLYRSEAGSGRWQQLTKGLPEDTQVQAITLHPTDSDVVYIGTHRGPYRSLDGGESWERLDFPDDGTQVWSIAVHPHNPSVLYAGTAPVGVFAATTEATTGVSSPTPRCLSA